MPNKKSLRILLTNFHPYGGGGHVSYIESLTRLNKINSGTIFTIGVAAPATSRIYLNLKSANYKHLYAANFPAKLHKELIAIILSVIHFRKVVAKFLPDIIHTNGSADLLIAAFSGVKNVPLIRTHHAIKHIKSGPWHKYVYNRVLAANIYVSESAKDISTSCGLKPKNIHIIGNGVDTSHYKPIPKNISLLNNLNIPADTFCFGTNAGTGDYKRVDLIILAAKQLRSKTNKRFLILALGEEKSGKKLELLAHNENVPEFVYCGFHGDTRNYVSLFDVGFILSDRIETISYAAREMMSMGKPLISSNFSGLKENVQDHINGFLIAPGNTKDLLKKMELFINMNKDELNEYSRKAREFAQDHFSVSIQLQKHANLYESI